MGGRRRRRTESLESGEQADGVEPFAEIDNLPVAAAELRDIVLAIRLPVTAISRMYIWTATGDESVSLTPEQRHATQDLLD